MQLDNKFWKNKRKRYLKRKIGNKGFPRDIFLIICEGVSTEPNYFEGFRLPRHIMIVHGEGDNTEHLVMQAIKHKNDALRYGIKYDQVWCVFDRDAFSEEKFNSAFSLARKEKIKIAYSNPAFELWYLLHFHYVNSSIWRKDYRKKLSDQLGAKYEKSDEWMYDKLLDKQKNAIANAKRLLSEYPSPVPSRDDPSTTIHLLVEELNKFL